MFHSIGVTSPSPLTLLRIIHQAQPLFKGGAAEIFDILEKKLPADFKRRYGLSWNLLKASLGRTPEPIVEIKVNIKIAVVPWYKGTPKPMIYIRSDRNSAEEAPLQWSLAMGLASQPSVIHNSLRYDDKTQVVTFHLREEDWNELHCSSKIWISSRELIKVITCEPVSLADDTVKSVQRVDPVETFGLFARQTFTVMESNEKCQVLKVIKVEESIHSYSAELEIRDSAICKAKAMKVSQPDESPTGVQINFEGATGDPLSMYFSCFVDINLSKFQISRKVGKIFCDILKRSDGTMGELVIQNLAPLPLHAMPEWDSELTDIRVLRRMFRTKLDLELKLRKDSGPPFFDLRDSIANIIHEHVKEPEIPKVHYVDERGIVQEPYDSAEDMLKKKGFVIKVEKLFKWKNLPVAKVFFCDCQRFADLIRKNPGNTQLLAEYCKRIVLHKVNRFVADQEEKVLFRKMMYTNAARVPQDDHYVVWKNSYISPLFPRESIKSALTALGKRKYGMESPLLSSAEPGHMDESSSFEGRSVSSEHSAGFLDPFQGLASHMDQECAFCHSKSGTLKRCLGCKNVLYCGKTCQKEHWKKHKTECRGNRKL